MDLFFVVRTWQLIFAHKDMLMLNFENVYTKYILYQILRHPTIPSIAMHPAIPHPVQEP
jgi:hypothetical protein